MATHSVPTVAGIFQMADIINFKIRLSICSPKWTDTSGASSFVACFFFFFCQVQLEELRAACRFPVGDGAELSRGPLIAKNFCGSILADCFVLTPHNNQLRHCQRNTHRSRFQSSVAAPFTSSVPTVGGSWRVLPPWTPPLLTSGSVVALPAKPRA